LQYKHLAGPVIRFVMWEDAMTRIPFSKSLFACVFSVPFAALTCAAAPPLAANSAEKEFTKDPTWTVPLASVVKADTFKWLDARKPADAIRMQAESLWPEGMDDPSGVELLQRVRTFALADPQARELVDFGSKPKAAGPLPKLAWLADEKTPTFERNNLRLWFGRWLSLERLYDDSLAQLTGLEPIDVVDPASLLFYQATANQWLLHKVAGLKAISRLLEREKVLPRRYAQTATLIQSDLAALEEESLDHVDRRMRDAEVRLDLGQAGKKVRGVEDGIIASLDKLIEDEEQKDELSCPFAYRSSRRGASGPAPDSARLKRTGPGEVAKKSIGTHSDWGNLNPRERQEVLQSIGKEYPSHYRDIIEQYFKRLAADDQETGK
jgi:hypothetical protein